MLMSAGELARVRFSSPHNVLPVFPSIDGVAVVVAPISKVSRPDADATMAVRIISTAINYSVELFDLRPRFGWPVPWIRSIYPDSTPTWRAALSYEGAVLIGQDVWVPSEKPQENTGTMFPRLDVGCIEYTSGGAYRSSIDRVRCVVSNKDTIFSLPTSQFRDLRLRLLMSEMREYGVTRGLGLMIQLFEDTSFHEIVTWNPKEGMLEIVFSTWQAIQHVVQSQRAAIVALHNNGIKVKFAGELL